MLSYTEACKLQLITKGHRCTKKRDGGQGGKRQVYNEIIAFTPYVSTATDVGGAQTYTLTMGP